MIRLAILASGNGTNAEAILEAVRDGALEADIRVILTNKPESGVIERARRWGIPFEIVPSKGHKDRAEYDGLVVDALRRYDVDTIALAGWMRILSQVFLDAFPNRIINLHPAILPSFKGGTGIKDAYEHGVCISGCSVHMVCPELDSGPLVIQAAVPMRPSLDEFEAQVHRMEHRILPQALQWFSEGRLKVEGRRVIVTEPLHPVRRTDYIEGCLVSPALEEKIQD